MQGPAASLLLCFSASLPPRHGVLHPILPVQVQIFSAGALISRDRPTHQSSQAASSSLSVILSTSLISFSPFPCHLVFEALAFSHTLTTPLCCPNCWAILLANTVASPLLPSLQHFRYGPQRAVDGNRGPGLALGSCTHTLEQESPWWRVALDSTMRVQAVVVYNRDMLGSRLSGAQVGLIL